ncbi:MAG TPA: TonB-dependent receptor, partial [Rhodothermales bacterium]|nr:TonB-dependent receptor [Rhodothermales bacterium]
SVSDPDDDETILNLSSGECPRLIVRLVSVLAVCALTYVPAPSRAQNASISGFVTDASIGRPLELVNVVLSRGGEIVRGVATNHDGLYLMSGVSAGEYEYEVSYIGYVTHVDSVTLDAGSNTNVNVELVPVAAQLEEVLVESELTGGAARVTAGQLTVRPADIQRVPGPGLSRDLATYLTTQPGIVATGDRGGQLFIRGGEPSQNLIQLDGILLYQPFHILGFYSAFPSDNISRVDIYAGGYGSEFGGKISSVIDVASRNGNMRRFGASASVSPFLSSAGIEGPIWPDRVSILASVRRSNIDEGVAHYLDEELPLTFGDTFAKLNGIITNNIRASVTGLKTYDRGVLTGNTGGIESEEISWRNDAVGLRFLTLPRSFAIMADLRVSYSRYETELGPQNDPMRRSRIENTHVAVDATYFGEELDVRAGSDLRVSRINSEIGGLYQNTELRLASVPQWGSYIQFAFDLGRGLRIEPGLRAQFYKVRFEPLLEPRIRAVWQKAAHEVSAAAGVYHQEILGITDRRDAASVFTVWANVPKNNPNLLNVLQGRPQRAAHGIVGYRATPTRWLELSVEGYYKDLSNLFISDWTAFPRLTSKLQPASGTSIGVDVRMELRGSNFDGYVNYGLSSTRYVAEDASIQLWYGEETLEFRPPQDRRHQLNVVANMKILGFDVSARWDFGSGLPFSQAVGFDGFILVDDIEKASDTPGTRRVIYERPFNALLPTYHRLDLAVERAFYMGPIELAFQGSIINVYDRRNIFYLDIFTLERVDQLPVVPSLGLKVSFE